MKMTYHTPNFRCQVSEKGGSAGKKQWVLCYAVDEDQARAVLDSLSLVAHKVQPYDFEAGWRIKAREELKEAARVIRPLIAAGRKPIYEGKNTDYRFDEKLWKELRIHLVIIFHNRCAYCQRNLGNDVRVCEVEHYRPKGKVDEDAQHPGYWWLAYEPTNYLPACKECNGLVKGNRFPLLDERQRVRNISTDLENDALSVDLYQDLTQEQPVLLNPYQDDPDDYLSFLTVSKASEINSPGLAIPREESKTRGAKIIEFLRLNENAMLLTARQRAQENVSNSIRQAFGTKNREALQQILRDIQEGRQEFYTAAKAEVQAYCDDMGISDLFREP